MAEKEVTTKVRKRLTKNELASRSAFEERVFRAAKDLKVQAWRMPPGPERDALLRRARRMDIANHMNEWLSSPGLQAPK
jgi:hypothetical protein